MYGHLGRLACSVTAASGCHSLGMPSISTTLGERVKGLFRSYEYIVEDEDIDINYKELIKGDEYE